MHFIRATLVLLCAAFVLWGQSFTASVRGVVTDQSSASIPGAKVLVTDADRGITFTAETDEAGRFVVTSLPPGNYSLSVESAGFKKFMQGPFKLAVQQQATVDVQMQVGDVSSAIEVEASAALVNTTIANLGQVVENKYIISLPNIGRDPLGLAYLTPGVVGAGGRRPGSDNNTNFVANGARNSTSDVLVDGVTVTTVEQNGGITDLKYKPSVDAVQEFKMQTNFFAAEYGETGGAVINMVTKSGTNDFHGTGYYFLRHSDLNANAWFSNRNNRARPYYRRDQMGGVIGGPVVKNKTFFFGTYQYTKQKRPFSQTGTFPSLLERDGNFTETFTSAGKPVTIYNPFDTYRDANNVLKRRPFAGNVIPRTAMDPVALKALAFIPKPNQTGAKFTNANNWFEQGLRESPGQQMDFKLDHNFNEKNRLGGRYSFNKSSETLDNLFGEGNPAYTFNEGPSRGRGHSMVADYTRTQNATTIFSIRYGLTTGDYHRDPMTSFDLTSLGLPSYMKEKSEYLAFPTFAPEGGYTDIGTEGWLIMDRQEGVHHITGSMTKVLGGHTMKVGAETRRNYLDYYQPGYPSGRFAFSPQITREDLNANPADQGNGFATMLLGWGTGSDYHFDPKSYSRSSYWGFFWQDDWKITRKLTLNLGLRYDFDVPRTELQNRYSYWDLDAKSPINVPGYDLTGVYRFTDDDVRSPFDGDYNNWQPRIGFAYAATEKLAIRAGYGLFYTLSRAGVVGHTGSGFTTNSTVQWTFDSNATRYATLSNPYPDGMLEPMGRSLGDRTFLGLGAGTIVRNYRNPEYHSWNLSIQRELPWSSVLELNYTGSRGVHLYVPDTSARRLPLQYWSMGRNELQKQVTNPFYGVITDPRSSLSRPTVQLQQLLRPHPQYTGFGISEPNRGDSNYHAVQVKYEKRFSHGVTLLSHYTWGKMIDNVSTSSGNVNWLGGQSDMQNFFDYRQDRALSSHDIAHRYILTFAWQLPIGKGKLLGSNWNRVLDTIAGGWEISGTSTFQSGMPLNVTQSSGVLWEGSQRPNLIGDPSTSGPVVDRLGAYYNKAAFVRPAGDTFGSSPRNLNYRGPGIKTLDAALLKSFAVTEHQRAEFRLEMQNATNTPIFGDPNGSFESSSFGTITGTKVGAREVQLGFKYYF